MVALTAAYLTTFEGALQRHGVVFILTHTADGCDGTAPQTNPKTMKMTLNSSISAFAGIALLAIGCSAPEAPPEPAPLDTATLTATIQGVEDAYAAAESKKDAAAVVEYYADDLVSYAKEVEPIMGKEALRQRLAERMAKDTTGYTSTYKVIELFPGTDHVTEIGSWTNTDATGAVKDHGTYFSVFKKNGEKWQCVRDIAVSHTPKAEPAPAVAAQ